MQGDNMDMPMEEAPAPMPILVRHHHGELDLRPYLSAGGLTIMVNDRAVPVGDVRLAEVCAGGGKLEMVSRHPDGRLLTDQWGNALITRVEGAKVEVLVPAELAIYFRSQALEARGEAIHLSSIISQVAAVLREAE